MSTSNTQVVQHPYTTTVGTHIIGQDPPDPLIPAKGSWMLLNTTAVSFSGALLIYWTWKRTTNTNLYG